MSLPQEILENIFGRVHRVKDILQCQLTCRLWYNATLANLYAQLENLSERHVEHLAAIVSNSPQKAELIKKVSFYNVSTATDSPLVAPLFDFVDVLIQNCPNIIDIRPDTLNENFWTQLMLGAHSGYLTKIQYLPIIDGYMYTESYVLTALAFHKTLTQVYMCDQLQNKRFIIRAFKALAENLQNFRALKELKIVSHSISFYHELDLMVRSCPKLESLNITRHPMSDPDVAIVHTSSGRPHLNVKTLKVAWRWTLDTDAALNYLMMKFPIVTELSIDIFSTYSRENNINTSTPSVSSHAFSKFCKYISCMTLVDIQCVLRNEVLVEIAEELIEGIKSQHGILAIDRFDWREYDTGPGEGILKVLSSKGYFVKVEILFPIMNGNTNLVSPHLQILRTSGHTIRTLHINDSTVELLPQQGFVYLEHIFSLCPNLRELRLSGAAGSFKQSHNFNALLMQSLKLLTVMPKGNWITCVPFLLSLSSWLSEIDYFKFDLLSLGERIDICGTSIFMPLTCFGTLEILMWGKASKLHVKLDKKVPEYFIIADDPLLSPTTKEVCEEMSIKKLCIAISCKSILKLDITNRNQQSEHAFINNV